MLKLVKYEWKKQRTSRLVILGLLVAGIIAFWGGILFKSDTVTALSLAFLYIFAVLVLFYTSSIHISYLLHFLVKMLFPLEDHL